MPRKDSHLSPGQTPGSDGYFDEPVAARYDDISGNGSALEFGSGTGRIALPLAERGVTVHGIDLSTAMTNRLHAKQGGAHINVAIGDFARTTIDESFKVVYIVFNTIMNLTTQGAQTNVFRNAAAHLEPGGHFVVEVMTPELQHLPPGDNTRTYRFDESRMDFDEYEVASQSLTSHHFRLERGEWDRWSVPFRYVWPSELDLMAELAGLKPHERYSGWKHEPFTSDSNNLIAVWEKPTQ
jgi:SAM-dependent methyltransferase